MRGPNQLAAIGVVAPKSYMQGSCHSAFRLARIGTLVLVPVTTPRLPSGHRVVKFVELRDCDDGSYCQPRRQVVGYIIQASGSFSEIKVTLVSMPDHGVQ